MNSYHREFQTGLPSIKSLDFSCLVKNNPFTAMKKPTEKVPRYSKSAFFNKNVTFKLLPFPEFSSDKDLSTQKTTFPRGIMRGRLRNSIKSDELPISIRNDFL